ncbi:MAG: MFS transporter [Rhodoferax sp.]
MAMASDWRALSPAARLLVLNGLAFNLGFYMVMPYLAQHLGVTLGLAGWASGLVMGLRVFSQQGLFLVGGSMGDRLGYRPTIVGGCLLRAIGFALLGGSGTLALLLLAAFLTGFAAALFTPCAQAYLASECPEEAQRQRAFALHNVASEAGMLLGPLLGMLLARHSYATTGVAAGALFALLGLLQWRLLPPHTAPLQATPGLAATWQALAGNRALVRFALLASAYQVLFHPLYLALPAYVNAHGHGSGLMGAVFTLSALLAVVLQLPLQRHACARLGVGAAMGLGLALMGASYLALPALQAWPVVAVLLHATLLSLGSMLCFALFAAQIPRYAPPTLLASGYGFHASVGGMAALGGNALTGLALGGAGSHPPATLWYALAATGLLAGWALWREQRPAQNAQAATT